MTPTAPIEPMEVDGKVTCGAGWIRIDYADGSHAQSSTANGWREVRIYDDPDRTRVRLELAEPAGPMLPYIRRTQHGRMK